MKYSANITETDSHSRTAAFRYFRAGSNQQGFNIRPRNVRGWWILEDRMQRPFMLPIHS